MRSPELLKVTLPDISRSINGAILPLALMESVFSNDSKYRSWKGPFSCLIKGTKLVVDKICANASPPLQ